MNLKDELLLVTNTLNAHNIPYAVCGGFAVVIHGCPRLTIDIDVIIREEDLENAKKVLAPIGFDLESGLICFKTGTPAESRLFRLSKVEGTEFLTLDLILVTPPIDDVWQSRQLFQFDNRSVWVVSRDGLIKMKRQAGRLRDQLDISMLENKEQ